MIPGVTITEEPLVTVQLLNEIRKFCGSCDIVGRCAIAKSTGALEGCGLVKAAEAELRQKAGCPACQ